ncbi:DsrH/TusB family sulfur metabolism protein [Pleionea mediterranea]|uniref:Sulfur relay protein TusB/DsrH n=1 Tax=Pleionea mediterranea TaxID=523701 RepID=A0A316FX31_9GAMM|nr:DsrH/TusB family sulfur metabolism protein [Pleionea mediterranea]PWK53261.1 sulfur relay protein TusB/DsrH [Pleionea mediterranea]
MSCLHIINRRINQQTLNEQAKWFSEDDAILLIEDALYLVHALSLESLGYPVYALSTDAKVRGVETTSKQVEWLNDYEAMVDITILFDKSITWTTQQV